MPVRTCVIFWLDFCMAFFTVIFFIDYNLDAYNYNAVKYYNLQLCCKNLCYRRSSGMLTSRRIVCSVNSETAANLLFSICCMRNSSSLLIHYTVSVL